MCDSATVAYPIKPSPGLMLRRVALAFTLAPLLASTIGVVGQRLLASVHSVSITEAVGQAIRSGDTVMMINPGGAGTSILLAAAFFAYPCALLLGIPALLALRRAGWLRIVPVTSTGAVIAVIWLSLLALCNLVADTPPVAASAAGRKSEVTLPDLLLILRLALTAGVLGSIGGVMFWMLAVADWHRPSGQRDPAPQP